MKKILLLITIVSNALSVYSQTIEQKTKSLNTVSKHNNRINTVENIPTLIISSIWITNPVSWANVSNIRLEIQNGNKVAMYELDYLLEDTISKTYYEYDQTKRLISEYIERRNQFGLITPYIKKTYSYDSSNNELSTTITTESFDQISSTWYYSLKENQIYNSRGIQIKSAYYSYDNNNWINQSYYSSKINYLNNTSNKTTEIIDTTINSISNTKVVYRKQLTKYDAFDREIEIKYYKPHSNTNDLVLDQIDSFYYSNSNTLDHIIIKRYTEDGNIYFNSKYTDIVFKTFNNNLNIFDNDIQAYLISYYEQNKYVLTSRYSTTYPDNFGSKVELLELYDQFLFNPKYKNSYTYNFKHHLIEELSQEFITSTNTWVNTDGYKYHHSYDVNNNIFSIVTQYFNSSSNSFINYYKYIYQDYQFVNTAITKSTKANLSIYPNPTNGNTLKIVLDSNDEQIKLIKIYNAQGVEVLNESNSSKEGIKIEHLNNGVYVIKVLTSNNKQIISKFIKD